MLEHSWPDVVENEVITRKLVALGLDEADGKYTYLYSPGLIEKRESKLRFFQDNVNIAGRKYILVYSYVSAYQHYDH